jgi:hypothetical protein
LVLNGQVDSFLYTSLFRFQQQNDNNSSTGWILNISFFKFLRKL